jgi:hypothetical protein
MKAQTPAEGIYKNAEFCDSVFYTVPCSCGSPDDEIEFSVEVDEFDIISVNTYFTPKNAHWKKLVDEHSKFDSIFLWNLEYSIRSFINGLYQRLLVTYQVWTQGYIKTYSTTILSEQQALNYANVLKSAIADKQKFAQKRKKNND